jgi:cyclophilin family peptidyl-prolyl cis-trans isomerase
MRPLIALLFSATLIFSACSDDEKAEGEDAEETVQPSSEDAIIVIVDTTMGEIVIELDPLRSPESVENFLQYVDSGYYAGTVFHRVIPDFMVQGGGFQKSLKKQKGSKAPIKNEAHNKISNLRGTVAMARSSKVDSATSQFFINLSDNTRLDHLGKEPRKYGYAVFGKVVKGLEIVDKMTKVETFCPSNQKSGRCNRKLPPGFRDVPQEAIVINSITRQDD